MLGNSENPVQTCILLALVVPANTWNMCGCADEPDRLRRENGDLSTNVYVQGLVQHPSWVHAWMRDRTMRKEHSVQGVDHPEQTLWSNIQETQAGCPWTLYHFHMSTVPWCCLDLSCLQATLTYDSVNCLSLEPQHNCSKQPHDPICQHVAPKWLCQNQGESLRKCPYIVRRIWHRQLDCLRPKSTATRM